MVEHVIKCWPEPFQAIIDGTKRHEIRVDDRGYAVGDVLNLREYSTDGLSGFYTGRSHRVRVTYKTPGGTWGLPEGLCVLSIEPEVGEYLRGVDDCIAKIQARRDYYELYREPGAMQTKPVTFAIIDEILVFLRAIRERRVVEQLR